MKVTADALDAGLLRYSDGAVIGTGGELDDAEPADPDPPHAADRHARGPRQDRRREAARRADHPRRRRHVKIDHQPLGSATP